MDNLFEMWRLLRALVLFGAIFLGMIALLAMGWIDAFQQNPLLVGGGTAAGGLALGGVALVARILDARRRVKWAEIGHAELKIDDP